MKATSSDLKFVASLREKGLTRGDAMDILAGLKEVECQQARDTLRRRMAAVVELYDN